MNSCRPPHWLAPRIIMYSSVLFFALLFANAGFGATHGNVSDSPAAELSAELLPSTPVVPGERVRVLLTVATPRWFTSGTRIRLPEVPGLVLLQNQEFASNATERRGDESWTIQRWSIDAFATRAGTITIPPIEVTASVSLAPGNNQTLSLNTQPLKVSVEMPPELRELDDWIASPAVSVQQSVNQTGEVAIGAAIKRSIRVKADDVMAMMLPAINLEPAEGLQTYPEPPLLTNRASRGTLSAQREDTVTLIATSPGVVAIDGARIHWWNTQTRRLTTLTTEQLDFTISGQLPPKPVSRTQMIERALYALAILIITLALLRLLRSSLPYRLADEITKGRYQLRKGYRTLTANPLPDRLNPGGSPAGPSAKEQPERQSKSL